MKALRIAGLYPPQIILLIALIGITTILSCNKKEDDSNPTENLLTIQNEYQVSNSDMESYFNDLPNDPQAYDYTNLFSELQDLSDTMSQQNTFSKVHYKSTDNQGNPITLSGLLIYPSHGIKSNTPLISQNHGTEMEKKSAPSQFVLGQSDILKYPEVMIAWSLSALNDWVIIMPDYQGMGDDTTEVHPYCIKDRLAVSTADMVEAAQKTITEKFNQDWKGNTYIMGYSEGGYVTMAALQELEKRKTDLRGALCMEGPYDLSGAMLDIMLTDTAFPVPYFLPYMLVAYHDQYPNYFKYDEMLLSPYNVDIPKYATGFYSSDKVNSIMPSDHILKEVFTDNFIDTLSLSTSNAHQHLYNNNSYIGWTPKTDMLLWHCVNDDCVPFANYEKVKSVFGSLPNITYTQYPPIIPVFHTIHQTAAPIAFMQGAVWIIEKEKE
jgi:pimeloyl-ACP methyl ester carboxylesterase